MTDQVVAIANQISSILSRDSKPFALVGIDGRSGSGKSSLAKELARNLNAFVLELDGYHVPMETAARLSPGGEVGAMIDYRRFARDVIDPIEANEQPVYRWASALRDYDHGEVRLRPSLLIVDGTFSCRSVLWPAYQFRILVERDRSDAIEGAKSRDSELPSRWLQYIHEVWIDDEDRHMTELEDLEFDIRVAWDDICHLANG